MIYYTPNLREVFDKEFIINCSLFALFNIIVFFATIRKYYPSWISYDLFFIVGFIIVHFQIPFLESIGLPNPHPTKVWINMLVVNYAMWLSCIFLYLWMLGFYLFLALQKRVLVSKKAIPLEFVKKSKLYNLLMIVSFAIFYTLIGKEFWSGNHQGSDNWGPGATYAHIFVRTFLFLSIIYLFYNNRIPLRNTLDYFKFYQKNKLVLLLTLFYCLGFLIIGDRGPLMQIALLYIAGYAFFVKKIKFSKILLMIIVGSFVLTIIGMGRTRDTSARQGNIFTSGVEKFEENDDVNPTNELAVQVRILYRALDVIPDKHPYLYGTSVWSNLFDIVPMSSLVTPIPKIYQSSTNFFTFLGQGANPTYGEGSEIIADLYINFGVIITLIIALLFGYYISFLTYKQQSNPTIQVTIIFFTLLIFALYINRANFLMPVKIIVYMLLFNKVFTTKIKIIKP